MIEYLQGRQAIYEYLYMAFYKIPNIDFAVTSKNISEVFKALGEETGGEIATGAKIICDYFNKNTNLTDEKLATELNISFTKIFNTPKKDFSLTETHYRSKEKAKSDIIISISNRFTDFKIMKPTEINAAIDSYSMELFFLYATSLGAAESKDEVEQDKILAAQFAFMKDHILCWTDMFTSAVIKKAGDTDFYSGLAHLSNGFLKYDFSFLEDACEQ